jgi:hypothetical protein
MCHETLSHFWCTSHLWINPAFLALRRSLAKVDGDLFVFDTNSASNSALVRSLSPKQFTRSSTECFGLLLRGCFRSSGSRSSRLSNNGHFHSTTKGSTRGKLRKVCSTLKCSSPCLCLVIVTMASASLAHTPEPAPRSMDSLQRRYPWRSAVRRSLKPRFLELACPKWP